MVAVHGRASRGHSTVAHDNQPRRTQRLSFCLLLEPLPLVVVLLVLEPPLELVLALPLAPPLPLSLPLLSSRPSRRRALAAGSRGTATGQLALDAHIGETARLCLPQCATRVFTPLGTTDSSSRCCTPAPTCAAILIALICIHGLVQDAAQLLCGFLHLSGVTDLGGAALAWQGSSGVWTQQHGGP